MVAEAYCQAFLLAISVYFLFTAWSVGWAYFDAERRYWNGIFWALVCCILPGFGLGVYLIMRLGRTSKLDSLKLEMTRAAEILGIRQEGYDKIRAGKANEVLLKAALTDPARAPSPENVKPESTRPESGSMKPDGAGQENTGPGNTKPPAAILLPDNDHASMFLAPKNRLDWMNVLSAAAVAMIYTFILAAPVICMFLALYPAADPSFHLLPQDGENSNAFRQSLSDFLQSSLVSPAGIFMQTVLLDVVLVIVVLLHCARTESLTPDEMGLPFAWARRLFAWCAGLGPRKIDDYAVIKANAFSDGTSLFVLVKNPGTTEKPVLPEGVSKLDLFRKPRKLAEATKGPARWPEKPLAVWKAALLGVGGGLLAVAVMGLLGYAVSKITGVSSSESISKPENAVSFVMILLSVSVLAPIAEEFMFRCYVFTAFKRQHGFGIGLAVSAIMFSIAHVSLLSVVPIVLAGLLMSFLLQRTGNTVANMATHATNNFVFFIALFLSF